MMVWLVNYRGRRSRAVLAACAIAGVLLAALLSASPALATEGPVWKMMSVSNPTNFKPGDSEDTLIVTAVNVGGEATDGSTITLSDVLPSELTAVRVLGVDTYREPITLSTGGGLSCLGCTGGQLHRLATGGSWRRSDHEGYGRRGSGHPNAERSHGSLGLRRRCTECDGERPGNDWRHDPLLRCRSWWAGCSDV